MKNKLLYLFMAVSLLCGMSSCNEKWEVPNEVVDEQGYGQLSTSDMVVDVTNAEKIVQSRADIDLKDYIITVTKKLTGETAAKWTYSEMPGLPSFEVGQYVIKVESMVLQKCGWDTPYFVGTKEFEISKDQITKVGTVTCKLQNLKVTVVFEEDLVNASAGDLSCTVYTRTSNSDGDGLTFTPEETRAGYFELLPESISMVAEFTGTVNGYWESTVDAFSPIKVGEHHIITFKLRESDWNLGDPTGGMNLGNIYVDMSVVSHDMTGNVAVGDEGTISGERPGKEDWGDEPTPPGPGPDDPTPGKEAATFVCPDGNLNLEGVNPVTVPTAIVKISCPEGIKNLNVTIESTNQKFLASAGELMPLSFDLAYPGDAGSNLASVGLPVGDKVIGKTEVDFVITELVPLLKAFSGDHTFSLEVVDKNGNKSYLKLRFKA